MRYVGYRWEEIIDRIDASSPLTVQWQRSFVEYSLNGWSMESAPSGRELIVIEGDAEKVKLAREILERELTDMGALK